ncbi:MAG: nucleoside triphosphate pyrophosphatase [bacterium]
MQIILASKSPRRAQLLTQIGLKYRIVPSHIDESKYTNSNPIRTARQLAIAKAKVVAQKYRTGIIIGADTIVVIDRQILGKPKDKHDARKLLSILSGRTHRVITGLAVLDVKSNRIKLGHSITYVTFRKLAQKEIDEYIATGDPFDKAGSYGIQGKGALFVDRITGDYFNVVGLPLVLLSRLLKPFLPKR